MDAGQRIGHVVGHSYKAGWIVLAYLISFTGCWTTLELLHRRTSARGYYNWYLLLAAAIVMGGVGIWCMHFIGNLAIQMDVGQSDFQIQYSAGYTVGSFLLPISVLALAFYLFSTSDSVSVLGTTIGGFLTGVAVCGMHYMSQIGLANYAISYSIAYVFGSAIIAIFTSTVALGIFFYMTATWTDSWWKRALCASLMAVSVSGMHWVSTAGCTYRLTRLEPTGNGALGGLSRQATTIVIICLSAGCCISLVALALLGQRSRKLSADRAQQVVLACATYDMDGKLMVTPEGLLPSRKITDSYAERSFDQVFDVNHPVFCWIFRASRCWPSVSDLLPTLRTHLLSKGPSFSDSESSGTAANDDHYSFTFKELFCVAASELSALVQVPLENIGVLSGNIMQTGTLTRSTKWKQLQASLKSKELEKAERGQSWTVIGRGQLLFLVRRLNRSESTHLQAVGHRFASVPNVVDFLAQSMEITREELLPRLENMRDDSEKEHFLEPGVHLACFALRPVFQNGFDILVRRDFNYLLPTIQISSSKLKHWQIQIIQQMSNWSAATCCEWLQDRSVFVNKQELEFAGQMFDAITSLATTINKSFFQDARLLARPLRAPAASSSDGHAQQEALVIAFRIITDAHQESSLNDNFEFAPSKLFLIQQHTYHNCLDNDMFARRIHREFAALAEDCDDYGFASRVNTRHSSNRRTNSRLGSKRRRSRSSPPTRGGKCSAWRHSIVRRPLDDAASKNPENNFSNPCAKQILGGIHVSNKVQIDVKEIGSLENNSKGLELIDMGFSTEASVDVESQSFADELMIITTDERRRQRSPQRLGLHG